MTERLGIEIDYCPTCRGVWLDRGELDKIIQKAEGEGRITAPVYHPLSEERTRQEAPREPRFEDRERRRYDDDDDDHYKYQKKKKSRGFLGDLLDF